MRTRTHAVVGVAWLAMLCLAGCGEDVPELQVATPDLMTFETEVYPVLLRDCGFHECHSSHERFFQVFGPGRDRLSEATQPIDPVDPEEVSFTYDRARSMINVAAPEKSLLLRKPLAVDAGGMGHEAVDVHGRDVYADDKQPGYVVLHAWVTGRMVSSNPGLGAGLPAAGAGGTTSP